MCQKIDPACLTLNDIEAWASSIIRDNRHESVDLETGKVQAAAESVMRSLSVNNFYLRHLIDSRRIEPQLFPLDKTGRRILPGDTLKIFHFSGPRQKKHYMYKMVAGVAQLPSWTEPQLVISHLSVSDGQYGLKMDGATNHEIEIVQGFGFDGTPYSDREVFRGEVA